MDKKQEQRQNLGYSIWKRVDACKDCSLVELALRSGVDCQKMKNQRTNNVIPRSDDLYRISQAIGDSVDYLISGDDTTKGYSVRVRAIADWLSEDEGRVDAIEKLVFGEKAGVSSGAI